MFGVRFWLFAYFLFHFRISESPTVTERHNPPANITFDPSDTTRLNSSPVGTLGRTRPAASRLLSTTQLSRQPQSTRTRPFLLQTQTIMARSWHEINDEVSVPIIWHQTHIKIYKNPNFYDIDLLFTKDTHTHKFSDVWSIKHHHRTAASSHLTSFTSSWEIPLETS